MAEPTVLSVDVGGSHVKVLPSTGGERRRFVSGPDLTPERTVAGVLDLTRDLAYDRVSLGIPARVHRDRVVAEPAHLGSGWVGFDFHEALGKPTKVVNDAAMQALGSYEGGKMLFLGLGTGLGSAIVLGGIVESMELAHLPFRKATFEHYVGEAGRERLGAKRWREAVAETVELLSAALEPDYVVLGGGNTKHLDKLPPDTRLGANDNAFTGGFRLWDPNMPSPRTE